MSSDQRIVLEQDYSTLYQRYVALIQGGAPNAIPVHLCMAPIATNMMTLASELRLNVKLGRRTLIEPGSYEFDLEAIRSFNEEYGTSHELHPWVLQRFGGHDDNSHPWTIWFEDLCASDEDGGNFESEKEKLERDLWRMRPEIADPDLLELGVCVRHVCRFNAKMLEELEQQNHVGDDKCVAVHIRRGDACDDETRERDPGRLHFSSQRYVEEMERFAALGYEAFYVLTESEREIERLKQHFGTRCRVLHQRAERGKFPSITVGGYQRRGFIEYRCLEDPEVAEFAMRTALVDIFNAGRCEALIGTFTSQFSVVNFLNIVGRQGRVAAHVNLSERDFRGIIFHSSLNDEQNTSLLVIKERNVGFFSMFLQVVNALLYLEMNALPILPFVNFSDRQTYFSGGNSWEEVFMPLVPLNELAIRPLLDRVEADFQGTNWLTWDEAGAVFELGANLRWTGSYYPRLNDSSPRGHISHGTTPTVGERKRAAAAIGKYVKLRPDIKKEVDDLFDPLRGRHVIGLYFRGTDARHDVRRRVPAYEDLVPEIEEHLDTLSPEKRESAVFYVASDEQTFIEFVRERYGEVHWFETVRQRAEDEFTAGDMVPAFIDSDRKESLRGCVRDFAGLCRSDFLIYTHASIPIAVLLTRDDLDSRMVGETYGERILPVRTGPHRLSRDDSEKYTLEHASDSNLDFSMNPQAMFIYHLADGTRCTNEIVDFIASEVEESRARIEGDVRSIIDQLVDRQFLELE